MINLFNKLSISRFSKQQLVKAGLNPVSHVAGSKLAPAMMQNLLDMQLLEVRVDENPLNGETTVELSIIAMSSNVYRNLVFFTQQLQKKYPNEPHIKTLHQLMNIPEETPNNP